ncbi:Ig-like domain-containing protein, partial [Winogradskyella poriferorum]|uniref:Ig-like domain-containing protein n=1 Tax=Winogradskyella poriferorum TaxID=307627 RepID=UPI003D64F6F6
MRNKYNCVSIPSNSIKHLIVMLFLAIPLFGMAQVVGQQEPSIRTGVTFQWSDVQDVNNNGDIDGTENNRAATIESITIDGAIFNTFVVPSGYQLTRLGPGGHNRNAIRLHNQNAVPPFTAGAFTGELVNTSATATLDINDSTTWDDAALASFQSRNLNFFFESSGNGDNVCLVFDEVNGTNGEDETDAQLQTLYYDPPIPSNAGGVIAVTERGGNNCFYVRFIGTLPGETTETTLGDTFIRTDGNLTGGDGPNEPSANSDYWESDREIANGQSIAIALYELNNIAPTGSMISRIEFVSATNDDGDGKFFILQKYAVDQQEFECQDGTFSGDLHTGNNVPLGSTYSIVTPPSPAGQSFTFNTDGTYTYVPSPEFTGDVTFEYEVCLPAPNTSVCDTANVTIEYRDYPDDPAFAISCDSGPDDFILEVTSPLDSNYEYSIDGGSTYQDSPNFNNIPAGTYNLVIRDKLAGCTTPYSGNAIVLSAVSATGTVTDVLCFDEETGAIDITVSGGSGSYTYSWSNGAVTEDLSNVGNGTYTVTITDTNGCFIEESFTVNQPSTALTTSIVGTDLLCFGDNSGAIDLSVSGGVAPYTYSWSNGSSDEDLSSLAAGTYNVTVTDANGCIANDSVTLTEPAEVSCQINVSDCPTSVDTVCSEEDGGTPVVWTPPSFTYQCCTSVPGDDYSFNMEFDLPESAFGAGCWEFNYAQRTGADNLRIFQSSGSVGTRYEDSYLITPSQYIDTSAGVDFNIELIDVTATVNWTLEFLNPDTNAVIYSDSVTGITTDGSYTIIVPNTVASDIYKVKFNFDSPNANGGDKIEIDRIYYNATIVDAGCTGGINFTVTSNYNPGDDFPDGDTTVIYTATYIGTNGEVEQLTCSFDVTVINTSISEDTASHEDVSCNGLSDGSLTVVGSSGEEPYSYSLDNIDFSNTSGVFENLSAGTYTVYIKDANDCSDSIQIIISEPAILDSSISSTTDVLCFGEATGAIDLEVSGGTAPYTYSWNNGSSDEDLTNLTAGDYTVTITDANGCITNNQVTINEPSSGLTGNINTVVNAECFGEATGSIDASASGGTSPYQYSIDNGTTNQSSGLFENLSADNYNILITDANGCSIIVSTTVDNDDTEDPQISVPSTITFEGCDTSDINNTNAVFEFNDSGSADVQNVFASNADYNASDDFNIQSITYIDTVTSTNNCPLIVLRTFTITDNCGNAVNATQTITVEDTSDPTIDTAASDSTVECDGSGNTTALNAWLASNGGAVASDNCGGVTWTNDFTALSDDCGATGSATVTFTATDACGNTASTSATFTIEDTTAPTITAPADVTIECTDNPDDTSLTGTPSGLADSCSGFNVGYTDAVAAGSCANESVITRSWTATDECGNATTVIQTITVEDKTNPTIDTVASDSTVECDGSGNTTALNAWLASN